MAAVTQANIDSDQSCQATADRLDQLDGDLSQLLTQLHNDTQATDGDVKAVNATLNAWTPADPLPVSLPASAGSGQDVRVTNWPGDQTVGFDSAAQAQVDGNAQALHDDFWFGVGLLGAAVIGWMAWRVFRPNQ